MARLFSKPKVGIVSAKLKKPAARSASKANSRIAAFMTLMTYAALAATARAQNFPATWNATSCADYTAVPYPVDPIVYGGIGVRENPDRPIYSTTQNITVNDGEGNLLVLPINTSLPIPLGVLAAGVCDPSYQATPIGLGNCSFNPLSRHRFDCTLLDGTIDRDIVGLIASSDEGLSSGYAYCLRYVISLLCAAALQPIPPEPYVPRGTTIAGASNATIIILEMCLVMGTVGCLVDRLERRGRERPVRLAVNDRPRDRSRMELTGVATTAEWGRRSATSREGSIPPVVRVTRRIENPYNPSRRMHRSL